MTIQTVYRPAIRTTYDGPTRTRGPQTYAVGAGRAVRHPWDNAKSDPENHRDAAEALAQYIGEDTTKAPLIGGGFGQTFVWVFDTTR